MGNKRAKVWVMRVIILMLVLGCVILAFGMTIVIKSEAGTGPNDLVAVVLSEKTGRRFSIVRLIVDALLLLFRQKCALSCAFRENLMQE